MGHQEHRKHSPVSVRCAVIIISDSRTVENDESGRLIIKALTDNGHSVTTHDIIKNNTDIIGDHISIMLSGKEPQVIITSGGTGASHLDLTVETVTPMFQKKLDGFGELFRQLTYQEIGTASIMSRAVCGIARGKVIICLPGSVNAVNMAVEKIILPEIGHMVREAQR